MSTTTVTVGNLVETELKKLVSEVVKFCKYRAEQYEPAKKIAAFIICLEYSLGPLIDKLRDDREFRDLIRILTGKNPEDILAPVASLLQLTPEELENLYRTVTEAGYPRYVQELARRLLGY